MGKVSYSFTLPQEYFKMKTFAVCYFNVHAQEYIPFRYNSGTYTMFETQIEAFTHIGKVIETVNEWLDGSPKKTYDRTAWWTYTRTTRSPVSEQDKIKWEKMLETICVKELTISAND